ncbi:MAG: hypothetical protein CHACPFDD_02804 [Phycisphaerae bacterium]|nr:hypothetical protein [Phycisphaerae bacterium]
MILSMTGFGEALLEDGDNRYHLETRSVNNRYFKASIRLPDEYAFLEPEVERLVRSRLSRGSVNVALRVHSVGAAAARPLNADAVRAYIRQLRDAGGDDGRTSIDLASLAGLPGVIEEHELTETEREHATSLIVGLCEAALAKLVEMRRQEGRVLADDLRRHCDTIRTHLLVVAQRAPVVVDEYRRRLHARVQELIAETSVRLAEEDLVREVGIFAERSDISEEISRLESHLEQFAACITSTEPAGRKLEFITQEMLREANTMGSKSADAMMARSIIEIKGAIDRLKEQVQNAE